jgi:hypothetical protein
MTDVGYWSYDSLIVRDRGEVGCGIGVAAWVRGPTLPRPRRLGLVRLTLIDDHDDGGRETR